MTTPFRIEVSRNATLVIALVTASVIATSAGAVQINELNYNPPDGSTLEYVELHNPSTLSVPLGAWEFTSGVDFVFPEGSVIEPGSFLIVCKDRASVLAAFPGLDETRVLGNYSGNLANGGERIVLVDASGRVEDELRYADEAPWDDSADGDGPSLQRICTAFAGAHPSNWIGAAPTPAAANERRECPPPELPSPVVTINELYYHPIDRADPTEEYIELRNNSDAPIDLKGYFFDDGVDFTFLEETIVEPGGFVVVCNDREAFLTSRSISGVDPDAVFGDFEGQLSNEGERVTLLDADGNFVDSVRYRDDGDWPVVPDGLGHSLEKINPLALSDDPASWTAATHVLDEGWTSISVAGQATSSRIFFYLDDVGEAMVDNIKLELVGGDGTNLIPNGSFEADVEPWLRRGNHENSSWDATGGPNGSGALRIVSNGRGSGSTNGVSLSLEPALDRSADVTYRLSFDYLSIVGTRGLTARISGASPARGVYWKFGVGLAISPGAENSMHADSRPPFVSEISRAPLEPISTDATWITARVRSDLELSGVSLVYSIDGEDDPATLPMVDDGAHGDGQAGDGVFGAQVPPQPHNAIVLYRIVAEADAEAGAVVGSNPHELDPTGFHGFYVNDEQRPDGKIPVLTLLMNHTSAAHPRQILAPLNCSGYRPASVAYRGEVYWNVGLRRRGQSVCGATKPYLKLRFQRGRDFLDRQHKINLQSLWTDKALVRERFAWEVFEELGSPTCAGEYIRLHVNGRYFGLYATLEHPDNRFLDRNNLDGNGNLYKAVASREEFRASYAGAYEKKTNEDGDFSDITDFLHSMHQTQRPELVSFFSERLDEDRTIEYQLAQTLTNNSDYPHKNHYLYHDVDRGIWMPLAWDMDLTFGKRWDGNNSGVYHDRMHTPGNTPWHTTTVDGGLGNHLLDKFFSQAGTWYRRAYMVRLWDALHEKYTEEYFEQKILEARELLFEEQDEDISTWGRTPPSADDRNAPAEFDPNLDRVRQHIRTRRGYLLNYIRSRARDIPSHARAKITELFYNPPGPEDELEFVEIWNSSGGALDLTGWSIEGLGFVFPEGSLVTENEVFVVARNPEAFRARYGARARVFGPYEARLDNNGEILRLKDAGPEYPATVDFLRYGNRGAWPARADGLGYSIELTGVELNRDNDLGKYWRASEQLGGSPGFVEGVSPESTPFRRGDVTADGSVNVSDAVSILAFLFRGFDAPVCIESADVNADTRIQLADAVYLLNALFLRGQPIPAPGPADDCAPSTMDCQTSNCVSSAGP